MRVSDKFKTYRSRSKEQVGARANAGSDRNYPNSGVRLTVSKINTSPAEEIEIDFSNEEAVEIALKLIKQAEENRSYSAKAGQQ